MAALHGIPLAFSLALMMSATTSADAQTMPPSKGLIIPATTLCNTGLTAKSLPKGCATSTLVTPINPVDGGPIVDGNWYLAEPYPSVPYNQAAPDPCSFASAYGPAPVNAPWFSWYNPNDQLSQWIEPLGGGSDPAGWYIYATGFEIPAAPPGYHYVVEIAGQVLVDNYAVAIYLSNFVAGKSYCSPVAAFTAADTGFSNWTQFKVSAPVVPATPGYLYFLTYNAPSSSPDENPTGLRVVFTSPYFWAVK